MCKMGKLLASILFSYLLVLTLSPELSAFELRKAYSWNEVDFDYPNDVIKEQVKLGASNRATVAPTAIGVWKDKLFLALSRHEDGLFPSLTYINLKDTKENTSPKLTPYPDWETHQLDKNGSKIISAHVINVDACDRLWIVDSTITSKASSGSAHSHHHHHHHHHCKVMVYDLKTDKIIDERQVGHGVRDVIVDVTSEKCDRTFAYLVYDDHVQAYNFESKELWSFKNTHLSLSWFGLALSGVNDEGHRTLHFHPASGGQGFSVSTKVLQTKPEAEGENNAISNARYSGEQNAVKAYSVDEKTGVLFFVTSTPDVKCWNPKKTAPVDTTNAITISDNSDGKTTQLADLKVDKSGNLWLAHYKTQEGSENTNQLVISTGSVAEIIKGTACEAA